MPINHVKIHFEHETLEVEAVQKAKQVWAKLTGYIGNNRYKFFGLDYNRTFKGSTLDVVIGMMMSTFLGRATVPGEFSYNYSVADQLKSIRIRCHRCGVAYNPETDTASALIYCLQCRKEMNLVVPQTSLAKSLQQVALTNEMRQSLPPSVPEKVPDFVKNFEEWIPRWNCNTYTVEFKISLGCANASYTRLKDRYDDCMETAEKLADGPARICFKNGNIYFSFCTGTQGEFFNNGYIKGTLCGSQQAVLRASEAIQQAVGSPPGAVPKKKFRKTYSTFPTSYDEDFSVPYRSTYKPCEPVSREVVTDD